MEIVYIWHDCFVVYTDSVTLIFDYWKDTLVCDDSLPLFIREINRENPVYVFVSHHHKDHYTTKIFDWIDLFPKIRYILSNDTSKFSRHILSPNSIYAKKKPSPEQVTVMSPGDRFEDKDIAVEAFGSTDIGNSYIVTVNGDTVFHAGDLNAWIWRDESTEEEVSQALSAFRVILDGISMKHPSIDYAMFPVDSRIGSEYYTGAKIFVKEIYVKHFFPMHFGLGTTHMEQIKYQLDAARINDYANTERGEYICLQSPYSSFRSSPIPEDPCIEKGSAV